MVSQEQPITPGLMPGNRFVAEERGAREQVVTQGAPVITGRTTGFPYFWRGAIAGTFFAITFCTMSYLLMLGCGVGVDASGQLIMSRGAAIWIVVTSALAYLLGGFISGRLNALDGTGWLSGLTVWGVSVPLILVLSAILSGGTGLASLAPQAAQNTRLSFSSVQSAYVWTMFIALIVGLCCAAIGGSAGQVARTGECITER